MRQAQRPVGIRPCRHRQAARVGLDDRPNFAPTGIRSASTSRRVRTAPDDRLPQRRWVVMPTFKRARAPPVQDIGEQLAETPLAPPFVARMRENLIRSATRPRTDLRDSMMSMAQRQSTVFPRRSRGLRQISKDKTCSRRHGRPFFALRRWIDRKTRTAAYRLHRLVHRAHQFMGAAPAS